MTLKEKREEALKELQEVKAAVVAGEKTADDLKAAMENFKTVQASFDAAEAAEKMLKALSTERTE